MAQACRTAGIPPEDFPIVLAPGKKMEDGSRRKGWHVYVTDVRGKLTNSTRGLPKGVEPRGHGQVLLPPSLHPDSGQYRWKDGRGFEAFPDGVPACPDWFYALQEKPEPKHKANGTTPPPDKRTQPYCTAALFNIARDLAATEEGQRDDELNKAAFRLGQLYEHGWFSEERARAALREACDTNGYNSDPNHPPGKFDNTFTRAWTAGIEQPSELPESDDSPSLQATVPRLPRATPGSARSR